MTAVFPPEIFLVSFDETVDIGLPFEPDDEADADDITVEFEVFKTVLELDDIIELYGAVRIKYPEPKEPIELNTIERFDLYDAKFEELITVLPHPNAQKLQLDIIEFLRP